jgi:hypothetical protein
LRAPWLLNDAYAYDVGQPGAVTKELPPAEASTKPAETPPTLPVPDPPPATIEPATPPFESPIYQPSG